jgi:hypothetical protein
MGLKTAINCKNSRRIENVASKMYDRMKFIESDKANYDSNLLPNNGWT